MRKILLFVLCTCSLELSSEQLFSKAKLQTEFLKGYTEEELALIEKDVQVVKSVLLTGTQAASESPSYLASAGPPGSKKTTILEEFIHYTPRFKEGVYLDPDQRALRFMVHTYVSKSLSSFQIAQDGDYSTTQKNAYNKWRPASNYITKSLFEEAVKKRLNIIHGTTSTSSEVKDLFTYLKNKGYTITLVLCWSKEHFRTKAISYRNQTVRFYQSDPKDEVQKAKTFPEQFPLYFSMADTLYFFWSDAILGSQIPAAVCEKGKLTVFKEGLFRQFVQQYENERKKRQNSSTALPLWEELLATYKSRFQ